MISSSYDFAGHRIDVAAEAHSHFAGIAAFLRSLSAHDTGSLPEFRIVVRVGALPLMPDDARILHSGPIWDEPRAIYAVRGQTRFFLLPDKGHLKIEPSEAVATITVTPEQTDCLPGLCTMHAIDAALEATGQFLLHGAALTLPDRSGGIFLHAASGTGKTTTTLRLAFDGMGIFTDDVAVIRRSITSPEIWGLPRDLKVHKNTAALDPEFAQLVDGDWDRNGEQAVGRDRLVSAGVRVETARPVPLKAFIHLVRDAATQLEPTSVKPISRTEALYAVAQDNVRGSDKGVPDFQRSRLSGIAEIIREIVTLECRVGYDFKNVTSRLLAALQ